MIEIREHLCVMFRIMSITRELANSPTPQLPMFPVPCSAQPPATDVMMQKGSRHDVIRCLRATLA
jgi:hypothetical protein